MSPAEREILMDLDARLRCAEGYLEQLLAQQREHLQEREAWSSDRRRLLEQNTQLLRHWRDSIRRNEAILEAVGRAEVARHTVQVPTVHGSAGPLVTVSPSFDRADLDRALREVEQRSV